MSQRAFTLHDLPEEERPRERLKKVGVDNLSLQELLALVIEKGKRGKIRIVKKTNPLLEIKIHYINKL